MEKNHNRDNNERPIDMGKFKEALQAYEAEKAALFARYGKAPHAPPTQA